LGAAGSTAGTEAEGPAAAAAAAGGVAAMASGLCDESVCGLRGKIRQHECIQSTA